MVEWGAEHSARSFHYGGRSRSQIWVSFDRNDIDVQFLMEEVS